MIDGVQSTGVTYSSVENVVARHRAYRRAQGGDPNHDGVAELLGTFDELGGPAGWAKKIGNSNRTSTRGGVLQVPGDPGRRQRARRRGSETPTRSGRWSMTTCSWSRSARRGAGQGQRSGITWHYVLMLAGIEG